MESKFNRLLVETGQSLDSDLLLTLVVDSPKFFLFFILAFPFFGGMVVLLSPEKYEKMFVCCVFHVAIVTNEIFEYKTNNV